jgi:hypothetical protein
VGDGDAVDGLGPITSDTSVGESVAVGFAVREIVAAGVDETLRSRRERSRVNTSTRPRAIPAHGDDRLRDG